ncbi:hypothetical protein K4F52_009777 [Lecanicillium sp. MT-2017a]|nr:hypothetical protein K4F52_009777 [Lecanicillium sp. MT-2017a]
MSSTPQRRRPRGAHAQTPGAERKRLDGLWDNNQWWCNCEPRRKAAFRQVKKESKNKGRFFFTCASTRQCDFFLWQDLANIRQPGSGTPAAAAQNNAASSSSPQQQQTRAARSPSTASTQTLEPSTPSKRRRTDDSPENDLFSDLGSDDEQQLAAMTDRSVSQAAGRKQDVFTSSSFPQTPTNGHRSIDAASGLPTPSVARTLFPTTAEKGAATTPTTTTASSSLADTPSSSSGGGGSVEDNTQTQVMQLLRGTTLSDDDVLGKVQALLATSERKMQGLVRGRDAVRVALRDKDVRIAELQERVTDLENRGFIQEGRMREMKAKYGIP